MGNHITLSDHLALHSVRVTGIPSGRCLDLFREILELKESVNGMSERLNIFADEATCS